MLLLCAIRVSPSLSYLYVIYCSFIVLFSDMNVRSPFFYFRCFVSFCPSPSSKELLLLGLVGGNHVNVQKVSLPGYRERVCYAISACEPLPSHLDTFFTMPQQLHARGTQGYCSLGFRLRRLSWSSHGASIVPGYHYDNLT